MRAFLDPRALNYELAPLSRPVNGHLDREEWSALRAVIRLECEKVPLSLLELPFQPRFLLQELIFLSSKMDGAQVGFVNVMQI